MTIALSGDRGVHYSLNEVKGVDELPPGSQEKEPDMNVEKIVQLIVMVCEVIVQRSGGSGLEARVAERIQAEVSPLLPSGHQALPLKRLEASNSARKGRRS